MNATLQIALLALVPVCVLFAGSAALFFRARTVTSFLQLFGAGCLVIVVLTHLSEALHLFPSMNWGPPTQHWSLPRFLECCSWPHVVSSRIFVSYAYKVIGLTKRCSRRLHEATASVSEIAHQIQAKTAREPAKSPDDPALLPPKS